MEPEIALVILAADPLVRAGLSRMIGEQAGLYVLEAADPSVLVHMVLSEEDLPETDLVVWDLGFESGELLGAELDQFPYPFLLLVSTDEQAAEAWHAGARAILSRAFAPEELFASIKTVVRGLVVFDPRVTGALLPSPPRQTTDLVSELTPRELEVVQLLAEGLTNKAISARLDISEHTVKFHVNAILGKLNAQSRTEAVVTATRLGMIAL